MLSNANMLLTVFISDQQKKNRLLLRVLLLRDQDL
jgi:hypothetical protein